MSDPWIGHVVGGVYRIVRGLGSGGAGTVYEARNERTGHSVALKILHPDLASDAVQLERFRREAHVAASIGHPNIARLVDFEEPRPGRPAFLALELVRGRSLLDVITRQPILPPPRAVELALQMLAALESAHRAGVVHRDLKPGNVVLDEAAGGGRPQVKIVDFGIAHMHSGAAFQRLTRTGVIIGTPRYMAPEQAAGGAIDGRTDLWSVGVILYRMLSGRFPFEGRPDQLLVQIISAEVQPPPFPAELGVPGALEAVVRRALEKRPAERWPSAAAMSAALGGALALVPATAEARLPPRAIEARTLPMQQVDATMLGASLDGERTQVDVAPAIAPPTMGAAAVAPRPAASAPAAPSSVSSMLGRASASSMATLRGETQTPIARIVMILMGAVLLGLTVTACLLAPWVLGAVGLFECATGGCVR